MIWRISEVGILAYTNFFYFDRHLTDILKYWERKSEIITLGNPPPIIEFLALR